MGGVYRMSVGEGSPLALGCGQNSRAGQVVTLDEAVNEYADFKPLYAIG